MAKAAVPSSRPFLLYVLMAFLTAGWGFIGYNFGGMLGAGICVALALLVSGYALGVEEDE